MSRQSRYELIIFDLDGTLLDTSEGIYGSVRFTEKNMGLPAIPKDRLSEFVGPPPKQKYMEIYGLDEEDAMKAVALHRQYGRNQAVYQAKVYPDMKYVLEMLRVRGCTLAVATLKSQIIAEMVLRACNIEFFFDYIVGMDEKESFTKAKILGDIMCHLKIFDKCVLIGDSIYDYEGAEAAGIDFIGALYGFGFSANNLYQFAVAKRPIDILNCIFAEGN